MIFLQPVIKDVFANHEKLTFRTASSHHWLSQLIPAMGIANTGNEKNYKPWQQAQAHVLGLSGKLTIIIEVYSS